MPTFVMLTRLFESTITLGAYTCGLLCDPPLGRCPPQSLCWGSQIPPAEHMASEKELFGKPKKKKRRRPAKNLGLSLVVMSVRVFGQKNWSHTSQKKYAGTLGIHWGEKKMDGDEWSGVMWSKVE